MGENKVRFIDYYDLIEFPSGKHIPVPIAIKLVGLREVLKIPISSRKRDWEFYYCEKCFEEFCTECEGGDCDWCDYNPYSFFRCQRHKPITRLETRSKEVIFQIMIKLGMHDLFRYIETAYHKDFAIIKNGQIIKPASWLNEH